MVAPLHQSCYLCNETIVDVQSWKRHMRQQHAKLWAQQEKQVVAGLGRIIFGRPCPFCKTEFQKTPAVHAIKCLPLLQLVSCTSSGTQISALWGSTPPLAPVNPKKENTEPGGRRMRRRLTARGP